MILSILVPTDFSLNAMKAALYAASIAEKSGAKVYLLHVVEPITDSLGLAYPMQEKLMEDIADNRINEMSVFQKDMAAAAPGIKSEAEIVQGSTITSILDFAEGHKIDLIVMGTKGATGVKEIFMGSMTAGIIGRTKIPVLAVPDEYQTRVPEVLLFATNRFEENSDWLNKIVDMAGLFSATIHVAVFADTDLSDAGDYIHNMRKLEHYMIFLKKTFPDIPFKGEFLSGKEFEEAINEYNEINKVDIIILMAYPKSLWEKLLKKSVTRKMAFHSKIPVLAIPAK